MTLHDDKTAQGWPLPHPDNRLEDDVLRLRQAVQDVDQALTAARQLIDTKASSQGVQDAMDIVARRIEQLETATQALSTGKVASVNGVAGVNVKLNPEHIALGPANGATSESFGYDAQGRISSITRSVNGFSATTAVSYDGAGRVSQQQTSYRGRVRTETYAYDAATGRVSGVNATEVQGMSFDAVNYAELRRLADSVQQAAQKVDSGRNEAAGHKAEVLAAMSGKLKFTEFRSSGYFYPSAKLLANGGQVFILAVGGGQGGARGGYNGNSGGAGGAVRFEIGGVGGPTSVVIGAGGSGQTAAYLSQAANGGDTSFGNLLAMGGRQFKSPTGVGDPSPRGSAAGRSFGVSGYGGPGGAGGFGSSGTGNATQPGADGVIGGLAMGNSSTGDYGNVVPGDPGYSGGGAGGTGVAGSATRGGHAAPNSGGGGGGGGSSGIGQHADGGNGGSGFVRVWWYE